MDAVTLPGPSTIASGAPPERTVEPSCSGSSAPIPMIDREALSSVLSRFGDPSVLAEGRVNIVSLDAVAMRLGARWEVRRDLIHEHAQRCLERHLGDHAVFQRIGETLYAVIQPEASRLTAQALCLRSLREILQHFLGEAIPADMRVVEVTRLNDDEVIGQEIDVIAVHAIEQSLPGTASSKPAEATEPHNAVIDHWTPFVSTDGRLVRVSCTLEPCIHLSSFSRIGYRLARRVIEVRSERPLSTAEQQNLSRTDIANIDYATIARGLGRLRSEADADRLPTLIVPVSYITLSNQRTRVQLIQLLQQAKAEVQHGLISEIGDIEGVPPGALATAIALVAPFCLKVIGAVNEPRPGALRSMKSVGLQGVSLDCPPMLGDGDFQTWLADVRTATQPVAKALFAYRIADSRRAALASLAGVTHATLRSGPPKLAFID